jgi:hypothetical protein
LVPDYADARPVLELTTRLDLLPSSSLPQALKAADSGYWHGPSADDPLLEEALVARLDLMRADVVGENLTPLEVLLTERVVSSWLVVEVLEALMSAQLRTGR